MSGDEGTLQSPNYPDDYRSNQDCYWKITVPDNYQVALKFELFQVSIEFSPHLQRFAVLKNSNTKN